MYIYREREREGTWTAILSTSAVLLCSLSVLSHGAVLEHLPKGVQAKVAARTHNDEQALYRLVRYETHVMNINESLRELNYVER